MGSQSFRNWTAGVLLDLPPLVGKPLRLEIRPTLTACGGKLLTKQPNRGHAVFAASFIKRREIVVEEELLTESKALRGILMHELFHFVWVRAGNEVRRNYAVLLSEELVRGARGELGESSEVSKSKLSGPGHGTQWKHYVCESFCDTAAWYFSGNRNGTAHLGRGWRKGRADWFDHWTSRLGAGVRL